MEKDYNDFERTQQNIDDVLSDRVAASGLQVLIDYLEFTIPIPHDEESVKNMSNDEMMHLSAERMREVVRFVLDMDIDDFIELPAGRQGYPRQLKWGAGNIFVLYGAAPRQGIHVVLSGKGCAAYHSAVDSLQALAYRVMDFSGKITRADFAVDDKTSAYFTVRDVLRHFENDEIIMRWKSCNIDFDMINHAGAARKECLYFGSMKSDCFLRVYNKTLEQLVQNQGIQEDFVEAAKAQNSWTRWEFVLRRENAHNAMIRYVNGFGLGKIFAGLMSNYFRITQKDDTDNNYWRWPMNDKWREFVGQVEPLSVKNEKVQRDIASVKEWVKNQVSPSLAAIMLSDGDLVWIAESILAAEPRISPALRAAVDFELEKKKKAKSTSQQI